jgi:hypothetical protein
MLRSLFFTNLFLSETLGNKNKCYDCIIARRSFKKVRKFVFTCPDDFA